MKKKNEKAVGWQIKLNFEYREMYINKIIIEYKVTGFLFILFFYYYYSIVRYAFDKSLIKWKFFLNNVIKYLFFYYLFF